MSAARRLVVLVALLAPLSLPARSDAQLERPASYRNPVTTADFPDPFVLRADGGYYAFGTHRALANIQILRSTDLVTWHDLGTALPFLPEWAAGPEVWAPSVLARPSGYVLYYAVRARASNRFCVSAAVSLTAAGPYLDRSAGPLACQPDRGGTIDPSPFVDADGAAYLLFKSEGIEGRELAALWSQRLRDDGLAVEGESVELLRVAEPWEHPIVENPAMVRDDDGGYHLLYSGNRWASADYAVGWARCRSPLGPCERGQPNPILSSRGWALGPGGADVFRDGAGEPWLVYHAWTAPHTSYPLGRRSLMIDRISFAHGRPWVAGPSTDVVPFDVRPGPPAAEPDPAGALPSPAPVPGGTRHLVAPPSAGALPLATPTNPSAAVARSAAPARRGPAQPAAREHAARLRPGRRSAPLVVTEVAARRPPAGAAVLAAAGIVAVLAALGRRVVARR